MPVKLKQLVLVSGDILLLYGALFLALIVRHSELNWLLLEAHLWPFTLIFALWLIIFYIIGFYELTELKNNRFFGKKFALALAINTCVAIAFFYFIPAFGITPKTNLFIFLVFFGSAAYAWRTTVNKMFLLGAPAKRLVVIGSNKVAEELVSYVKLHPQLGYEVLLWIKTAAQGKVTDEFRKITSGGKSNIVAISQEAGRLPQTARLVYESAERGTETAELAEIYEKIFRKIPLSETRETALMERFAQRRPLYDAIKPPLERLCATALALMLLPVSALIAAAIKIDSPGSAFFTQMRVGKGGKAFVLWKFRTMREDAEKQGPQWAKPKDKRVTSVGRLLRRTHLDELPQLWNIMRGELSLVGPRPERPEFVAALKKTIPFYDLRHTLVPGLTGWAQVNYRYGASTEDAYVKLEYDIYYIKYRSLWFDLAILIRTLKRFFVEA